MAAIEEPLLIVRDGRVLRANPAARAVLGAHIDGADIRLAIRHPVAIDSLSGAGAGEAVTRVELVGLGGQDRRWEMTVVPFGNDGSRLVRLIDHSAAYAADKMRSDFVANASHELRTPLAALMGFIETLQDERMAEDKAARARFLGIMSDQAQRMHRLIEDLMSLSRIEADRFRLPDQPVDLVALAREARAASLALAVERNVSIRIETGLARAIVRGDRAELLQLLHNLITNALKYGRSDSEVIVDISENSGEMLRISVIDKGEGIAPEHLPRITERFYRVSTSRSRAEGGTGLGLAIVKHVVGRHRGRLDIRSVLGEGTAVHIYLPRAA
jgi:two-component system phosphate regulon sensor histidine kinase PhoR